MQYMLMFYQPAAEFEQREDASAQDYRASWVAYADAVRQSGISLGGHGLFPPMTGTTLRVRGDRRQVQDGPFADTKEQLGGYFVIDVPDLDAALEWAARAPCATSGGVEVRPVFVATALAAGRHERRAGPPQASSHRSAGHAGAPMNDPAVHGAAERAARESYGRLLAILSARTHDIAASEDALADAFARALERWPADGVPAEPDAWLLSVARHRKLDAWRHSRVQDQATQTRLLLAGEVDDAADGASAIPDERLRLLFVCAHPAVDAPARAPLMLQTVLGLDAARMAGAFLTAPSTLGQRLVRAKARIRAAGIPFEYPQARDLPQRLQDVLDGIYAAYGTGWDDIDGADALPRGLTTEAIDLCRILCGLMPAEPEPLGLLALMLFCEARMPARRSDTGAYVPLDQQDPLRWNPDLLAEAELCLRRASEMKSLGAYQLEAAIQSAHCERRVGAPVPPEALVSLYEGLLALRTSIGAQVSLACALANARGPEIGLRALESIPAQDVASYQPYWAARAHLLAAGGARSAARQAFDRAIGLSTNSAVRAYLHAMSDRL